MDLHVIDSRQKQLNDEKEVVRHQLIYGFHPFFFPTMVGLRIVWC